MAGNLISEEEAMASPTEIKLPASDQPCKECKRRRAKCDRGIPECSVCARSHRHCLYERHSRTPLTRKHLTQVEAKLERAEALLRQYRLENSGKRDQAKVSSNLPGNQRETLDSLSPNSQGQAEQTRSSRPSVIGNYQNDLSEEFQHLSTGVPLSDLEEPPAALEDLEWNEQAKPMVFGDSRSWRQHVADLDPPLGNDGMENILDGMAMLSVDGKEVGYVGVASGAAFLKYLWRPSESKGWMCGVPSNLTSSHSNGGVSSLHLSKSTKPQIGIDASLQDLSMSIALEPNARKVIADSFVDAYFALFHSTLPIVHEASFRDLYDGKKTRPSGLAFTALANIVAAIGAFSAMTECLTVDTPFFYAAKSALSIDCLETGSMTLVQALTLMSYYFQKRNKPNSGYTYAGLATRIAFGLGLHREFPSWNLPALKREIRRRVFWSVFVVDGSICVTLSRPVSSVRESTDIPFPLNVQDDKIDDQTILLQPDTNCLTANSTLRAGATFYLAADNIYKRLIKHPYPSLDELMKLDDRHLGTWHFLLPPSFRDEAAPTIGNEFALAHHIAMCRYRNLRIIMFRPFIIPLLQRTVGFTIRSIASPVENLAYERCIEAARNTISATAQFWNYRDRTRLAAWYLLYFAFQATLIPLVCLRNAPFSEEAERWRADIRTALTVIEDIRFIHGSKCAAVIHELSDEYMDTTLQHQSMDSAQCFGKPPDRVLESHDFSMLFPTDGSFDLEADVAWHMVWPEATGSDPRFTFDSDGSMPSTIDGAEFDLPPMQMNFD